MLLRTPGPAKQYAEAPLDVMKYLVVNPLSLPLPVVLLPWNEVAVTIPVKF